MGRPEWERRLLRQRGVTRGGACLLAPTLVAALLACACSDTENHSAQSEAWECTFEDVDDDVTVPSLGFSVTQVLSWSTGTWNATAAWRSPLDGYQWTPASGEPDVELQLGRADGAAQQSVDCSPHFRIPIALTISTSDGALAESLHGTLSSSSLDLARVEAPLSFDDLAGSLAVTSPPDGRRLVQPTVALLLSSDAHAGTLGAIPEQRAQEYVSAGPDVVVLSWPAGSPCVPFSGRPTAVPVPVGAATPSWAEMAATYPATSWTGTWQDGATVDVQVTIDTTDDLCVGSDASELLANVTLSSADSRLDTVLDGQFTGDEGQAVFSLAQRPGWGGTPETFIAQHGDFGLDLEPYEHVSVEASLRLTAGGAEGAWAVVGYRDDCQPVCDNSGCSGCPPMTRISLLELRLIHPGPP